MSISGLKLLPREQCMNDLPTGWSEVAFEDIVDVNPRKFVDLGPNDCVTFVPMAAVSEISGTIVGSMIRPLKEVSKGFTQFVNNDILFAKITPSMENGKSAVAVGLENGIGIGSTEFHVLRSRGAVLPEYLWRFIRQESFRAEAQKVMSGAVGQQRVPADYLKAQRLPLAPIAEQKRIVERIDRLTTRTSLARAELDHIPELVKKYKAQLLIKAFKGELTRDWRATKKQEKSIFGRERTEIRKQFVAGVERDFIPPYSIPSSWRWLALPEIGDIDRGRSRHRPRNDPRLFGGFFPFVQTGDVRAADRFLTNYNETYSEFGLAQSRLWPTGTVCITIAANIAETAILCMEACFPDSIVGFLADEHRVSPGYVEFFIRTMRDELDAFAPATAQKNINLNVLSSVRVPVPPIEEQTEIVHRIENAFSWIDRVFVEHELANKLLPKLDAAIYSKAYRGELVSQNATDEPACTLLARVLAEYNAAPKPKARRQKKNEQMTKTPKELLLADSAHWPDKGIPFEEVAKRNPISYEDLRDAIFALLAEEKPRLRQVFDKDDGCILLQAVKS